MDSTKCILETCIPFTDRAQNAHSLTVQIRQDAHYVHTVLRVSVSNGWGNSGIH